MDFIKNAPKTDKLPKDIKPVRKNENLYEKDRIEKAGYKLVETIDGGTAGNFTVWENTRKMGTGLIFIEKLNGFFAFGGYVRSGINSGGK
jgi:hypothetical protein